MSGEDTTTGHDELDVLFPDEQVVTVRHEGKEVAVMVRPLLIRQSKRVIRLMERIALSVDEETTVQQLLLRFPEEMASVVAAAVDRPDAFYDELRTDDGLKLAIAVFEVNVPFFVNVVAPMFSAAIERYVASNLALQLFRSSASMGTPIPRTTQ